MDFEWDVHKAESHYEKHGVRFPESLPVFEDDYAITIADNESDPLGMGAKGRVLVTVYSYRGQTIPDHFSTIGRRTGTTAIRGEPVKQQYDFSKGARGRVAPHEPEQRGKTRITIRIDEDLVDHFLKETEATGGAIGYQTLINNALRQYVEGKAPKLEDTLRRVLREEMSLGKSR